MGRRVDPDTAVVHVDGDRVVLRDDLVLPGAEQAARDALDDVRRPRPPCVGDLVWSAPSDQPGERLFHVGRLDADTEGLLLLTNDGELGPPADAPVLRGAARPTWRRCRHRSPRDLGKRLRAGVELEDGPATVDSFELRRRRCPAARWSRSCCTRAASTSCGGCSTRSATRSSGWCAPRSARCSWATSARARSGRSRSEIGQLYRAVGL